MLTRKASSLLTMAMVCSLGLLAGCSAVTDVDVKTSRHRDTLLYVRTHPSGAKVFLNGKEQGISDGLFRVQPGVGKLLVELEGHNPDTQQVTIRANWITRVELTLKPVPKP